MSLIHGLLRQIITFSSNWRWHIRSKVHHIRASSCAGVRPRPCTTRRQAGPFHSAGAARRRAISPHSKNASAQKPKEFLAVAYC